MFWLYPAMARPPLHYVAGSYPNWLKGAGFLPGSPHFFLYRPDIFVRPRPDAQAPVFMIPPEPIPYGMALLITIQVNRDPRSYAYQNHIRDWCHERLVDWVRCRTLDAFMKVCLDRGMAE